MSKLQQLIDEISAENGLGVLLATQMDSVPDTLQFIIATTEVDEAANGLRDKNQYVLRAIGVREHKISVGMFRSIDTHNDHPLLYETNTKPVGVFFRGTPADSNELLVDIFQAYASTLQNWRQIPTYLNTSAPLLDILTSGGSLLGQMPKPVAERMEKVLQHHNLETNLQEGEIPAGTPTFKALMMDESYVVAMDFTADLLGKA